MKAFIGLLAIGAACGIVGATNCTVGITNCTVTSTATVTIPFPINGTGTETAVFGTGLTSVYNDTTSFLSITGSMTNPFDGHPGVLTIHSYVTVPVGTCTIDQPCPFFDSDPLVSSDRPFVNSTTDHITQVSISNSVLCHNTTQDSVIPTRSASITAPASDTPVASPAAPADSTSIAPVTISTTSTSFETIFSTEFVTAEPKETATSTATVSIPVPVETSSAVSSSSSLSVLTITVIPVPASPSSKADSQATSTTRLSIEPVQSSASQPTTSISFLNESSFKPILVSSSSSSNATHPGSSMTYTNESSILPVTANSITHTVVPPTASMRLNSSLILSSTDNTTGPVIQSHASSTNFLPSSIAASNPVTTNPINPIISPFTSRGHRLSLPAPIIWLMAFLDLNSGFYIFNTNATAAVPGPMHKRANTMTFAHASTSAYANHSASISASATPTSNGTLAQTSTVTMIMYNGTRTSISISVSSYFVYTTINHTLVVPTLAPTANPPDPFSTYGHSITTTIPTLTIVSGAAGVMKEMTWLDYFNAGVYVVVMVYYLTVVDPLI